MLLLEYVLLKIWAFSNFSGLFVGSRELFVGSSGLFVGSNWLFVRSSGLFVGYSCLSVTSFVQNCSSCFFLVETFKN